MPALFDLVESEPEPVRASNPVVAVGTTIADRAPYRSVASRGEHCVHQSRHTLAYFSPIRCIGLTPRNRGYRAPSSGQPAVPWNAPSPPHRVQRRALDRQDCEWAGDAGSYYQPVLAQSSLDRTLPTDCVHRSVTRSDRVVNSAKGSNPNHRQMWDTRGAQSSLVNPKSAFPLRRCSRHPIAGRTNGLCKHYRAMHLIGRAA